MPAPVAVDARVSLSKPGHRLVIGNRNGGVTDWPEWTSLDVIVGVELEGDRRAEPPQLVAMLRDHGIESTLETLTRLPLTIVLDPDVEARLAPAP